MKHLFSPRSRLLSFRVTGEEYETLCEASATQGARCLSDFARKALMCAVGPPSGDLAEVDRRISALEFAVAELRRRLCAGPQSKDLEIPCQ